MHSNSSQKLRGVLFSIQQERNPHVK